MTDLANDVHQLRQKFDSCAESAGLSSINREISDISTRIETLGTEIQEVRSRGYAFRSYLENKAAVLKNHWSDIRQRVQEAADEEISSLRTEVKRAEFRFRRLNDSVAEPEVAAAKEVLEELENKIDAAEKRIQDMYATLKNDMNATFSQLHEINWCLDQKDEASFDLLAGESLFLAAKAEWVASGNSKQDPDGIIFLTDQRLIFEQKETTGKRLGLFGGKKEQEVEWALPIHEIDDVSAENKGFLGGKDMLYLETSSGKHPRITVEVKGGVDCKFWQKQIQRMISGDTANERAIEPDPELIEQLRNAPTACHVCGGTLPRIVAGQLQVDCEYCGAIIRI
ncbi:MAG: hypothetical protein CL610_04900 [Anaerolineaceae bacterium]|nr:hypothetical protein [Anaerolineaceae bacterium]